MSKRFIFKFRNDLVLPLHPSIFDLLSVPEGYETALEKFVQKQKKNLPGNLTERIGQFSGLLHQLNSELTSTPLYVFRYSTLETFREHRAQLQVKPKNKYTVEKYQMPNFYLWFEYILPDNIPGKTLKKLCSQLYTFLRTSSYKEDEESLHLLDFAYLKEEAMPAAPPRIRVSHFVEHQRIMNIPPLALPPDAPPVAVAVIEKAGWNANHREFARIRHRIWRIRAGQEINTSQPVLVNYRRNDLLMKNVPDNDHGTKTLGILIAPTDGTHPDCEGLLPSNTSVVLSSCSLYAENTFSFSEPEALKRILDYYLTPDGATTARHLIILFEIQTRSLLPISVEPLQSELIQLAAEHGHTVIIPMGNPSLPRELTLPTLREALLREEGATSDTVAAILQQFQLVQNQALYVGAAGQDGSSYRPYCCNWNNSYAPIYAHGTAVLTTTPAYYGTMDFTSAAAAILAGVAGLVQTHALQKLGRALTHAELRSLLNQGTPVRYRHPGQTDEQTVGHIPNVGAALSTLDGL